MRILSLSKKPIPLRAKTLQLRVLTPELGEGKNLYIPGINVRMMPDGNVVVDIEMVESHQFVEVEPEGT